MFKSYCFDRMELLEEHVCLLKVQLQSVKQEREDDLKNYASLLDETRKIFFTLKKEYQENSPKL